MRVSTNSFYKGQLDSMLAHQKKINEMQQKISSGKNLTRASEDPVSASKANGIKHYISTLESYQKNIDAADTHLNIVETTTNGIINSLQRASELTTQGINGTLQDSDRNNVALELEAVLDNLVRLANTKNHAGEYLFSGFNGNIKPYVQNEGVFAYQGDQGQRIIGISDDQTVEVTSSGFHLFEDVRTGNGTFTTQAAATNTGTGQISPGSVGDQSAYVADNYTINFVTNGAGDLAYEVTGATSGQVFPASQTYVSGESIVFNGMEIQMTGTPAAGDQFTVEPSQRQNLFTSLQQVIDALKTNTNSEADIVAVRNNVMAATESVDRGFENVVSFLAEIGMRSNLVEQERNLNESLVLDLTVSASSIEDIDYTQAVTEFNNEVNALQYAQQTYLRVQNLSIFNFL